MDKTPSSLSLTRHALFWLGVLVLFTGFVWLFKAILLPFVLGLAIAYLLDPVVRRLERRKIPRSLAALLILLAFIAFISAFLALVLPPLYQEMILFAEALPGYIAGLWDMAAPHLESLYPALYEDGLAAMKDALQQHTGKAINISTGLIGGLVSGGQALVGAMSLFILTPLVAFFMLREWDKITGWVDGLIPRGSYDTVKYLVRESDHKIAAFIRGQLIVAFILGTGFALALSLAGLKFGVLIGITTGILSIIPLVGSTIGLIASITAAWFQSTDFLYVGLIALIYLTGQVVETNFLTPKIMGRALGLHPLWIIFALMAGASLFGIVGMLIAVPFAAIISVLAGFGLDKYRESAYYAPPEKAKKS